MALSELDVKRAQLRPRDFLPHCQIQHAEGGPPVPFKPWDFQLDVLHDIERQDRIVVLKARQLGLSWLTLAYMLWLVSCNPGITALILNRGLRESVELLDRVRFMVKHLPRELRPVVTKDVVDHMEFGLMGGRIFSLPASEYAGSGVTAQLVMVDEWAKIRGVRKIMTSLLPTLSAGGKLIGVSTAVGFHNPFAEEWRRAISGQSRFFPIFIPWDAHPHRDQAWYEEKRRELPTERELLQEYPAEWLDAFQLPGESVFRDEFDRARHVTTAERDPKAKWPVWRGIDFGYHHGVVLWASIEQQREVYVFAELHAEKKITRAMMQEAVVLDVELGVDTATAPAGVDPAGKAQTSIATESEHYVVESFGIDVRFETPSVPRDRVTLIKQLLKEERLHVHARCEYLIEALEQAQWDTKGPPAGTTGERFPRETYQEDGYYEHVLDALGYMLINVFPPAGRAAGVKTKQPSAGKSGVRRYSESEFG